MVSQEELIEHVWDQNADSFSGVIRVHIATLRKKLKALLNYDPIGQRLVKAIILRNNDGEA